MTAAPQLRPYQRDVVTRVADANAADRRRLLLLLATGTGKTVIAAAIIGDAVTRGDRVLLLAHRRELIVQASRKLHAAGVDHGVLLPGVTPRLREPVQVASIATLHARAVRSAVMELPQADLVIVDEAHHAPARTYRRLLETYRTARVIGLTATPCRSDGRGLGSVFEAMIEGPPVAELIAAGYLVAPTIYAPTVPNLSGVHVERGDYVESQLADRMDDGKLVGDIVEHWLRLARHRPTVVFASSVAHSVLFATNSAARMC